MSFNNDGSADLKVVERIINSTALLLVDMYKRGRFYDKPAKQPIKLRHQPTAMDELKSDPTKPIWPLNTTFAPQFVCSKPPFPLPSTTLHTMQQLLLTFAYRLKNEHEDQSSLRINLDVVDPVLPSQLNVRQEMASNIAGLFKKLNQISLYILDQASKDVDAFNDSGNDAGVTQMQWMGQLSQFYRGVLSNFLLEAASGADQKKQRKQSLDSLMSWVHNFNTYLCRTLDSEITSTVYTVMPNLPRGQFLPLAVHPLLICIYHNIMTQMHYEQDKRNRRNPGNQPADQKTDQVFADIKNHCSKIVFVNLDGYESEHNVDVARSLCRHLMYISFPRESYLFDQQMADESENLRRNKTSERMLSRYNILPTISPQAKIENFNLNQRMAKMYQLTNASQLNKNIFVLPIYSRALSLHKSEIKSIKDYESNFVYYMFHELLNNQIHDFGPSVIIISYSGKLAIQNRHFVEIIKNMVKLGNYSVILWPNLTKTYMPQEHQEQEITQYFSEEYQCSEQGIFLERGQTINTDLLDKLSIFTKISSGTFSLDRADEQDSMIQKYRNGQVMGYVSPLLDFLRLHNETINKVHFKWGELASLSSITKKYFEDLRQKPILQSTVNPYYQKLLRLLCSTIEQPLGDYSALVKQITNIYPRGDRLTAMLNTFQFEYELQVMLHRNYKRIFMVIRHFAQKDNQYRDLVTKEFEVDGQRLDIFTYSRILYDGENRNKSDNILVYLTNHLHHSKDQGGQYFTNFVGRIHKDQKRVRLTATTFELRTKLQNPYTLLTDWNYHQTSKYVFLYWPQKFEMLRWLLCRIARIPYLPEIQNMVLRANVANPHQFVELPVSCNRVILPRYGCSAYSFQAAGMTQMFVFGGFYKNTDNYMKFQNNVDHFIVSDKEVKIENVSKSKLKVAVRPRINYQIQQLKPPSADKKLIAILGGYGQVFIRPYNLTSSVYYRVQFNAKDATIESIQRKPIDPIRVNVPKPIKMRTIVQLNVLDDNLTPSKRPVNSDGFSFHNTQYVVTDKGVQKKNDFEFGLIQQEVYRQEVDDLKKSPDQASVQDTKLKLIKGVRNFNNSVILLDGNPPYLLVIMFETQHEARTKHPTLKKNVHVTTQSIIALTNSQTFIYAILKHPVYVSFRDIQTLGKCILAEFNMSHINNTEVKEKGQELLFKQSHRFRQDITRHAIMVVKPQYIAVLHGPKHLKTQQTIPEFILRKRRDVNQMTLQPCSHTLLPVPMKGMALPILSSSLFNKIGESVHCYSFGTVQDKSLRYMHLQLNLLQKFPTWRLLFSHEYQMQLPTKNLIFDTYFKQSPHKRLKLINFISFQGIEGLYDIVIEADGEEFAASLNEKQPKPIQFTSKSHKMVEAQEPDKVVTILDKRLAYRDFEDGQEAEDD